MKSKNVIYLILFTLFLQSCADTMNKQGAGTLIGGATGALIGSRFGKGSGALAATGIGALAGAIIGGQVGKSMDEQDRMLMGMRSQEALEQVPSGNSVEWRNPDSGNYGYITPTRTFQTSSGQYCREYTQVVVIGGKEEKAYGRACRKPDGQWQIVE